MPTWLRAAGLASGRRSPAGAVAAELIHPAEIEFESPAIPLLQIPQHAAVGRGDQGGVGIAGDAGEWSQHEQLAYPIAHLASVVIERRPEALVSDIFHSRLFWFGGIEGGIVK